MTTPPAAPVKLTPMMQQYLEIKALHQDAILFYRLGDFYEMFFEDAVTASKVLGITLTSRNGKGEENRVPLCGVPYHAASTYLAKLIRAGIKVAICEQVEDPKEAKGVVKREVVRVVTPGLVTEAQLLDDKENRYLAALCRREQWGGALVDLSTGEFLVAQRPELASLLDELARLNPAELLLPEELAEDQAMAEALALSLPHCCLTPRPAAPFHPDSGRQLLLEHFRVANLAGFGCEELKAGIAAAGGLLHYLSETQKAGLEHIERLTPLELDQVLLMDDSSRRNLELTQTIVGAKREGSLLHTIDHTCTPMGARLLKRDLLFPLREVAAIEQRLDSVEQLVLDTRLREGLRGLLDQMYDLERLNGRVVLGNANARDLTALSLSLAQLPAIRASLAGSSGRLAEIRDTIDELADIRALIAEAIRDDAPVTLREGNLIRPGHNNELDELTAILRDGRGMILALEARERQRSGIANLKVGFNKVFGYYLEVSKAQLANVPEDFIRKQTLVNAERFITPELKEFEGKVTGADERRLELEYQLFCAIRNTVAHASSRILAVAALIARLDCFCALAEAAHRFRYTRPRVDDGEAIIIREGRHPVIERSLPPGRFVPNDVLLDRNDNEVLIITGPNMAGKSTVLRQTALITLMAQMGSFVPAAEATIGLVDRIFTRVGAMDDLRRAQSTFMVEMNETANILNNATDKSLVILDEIGRGTSTFDGLSIAWAVAEELVTKNGRGVKTIFATHYHELTELAAAHQRVKNFNIAVREWNDSIIFLHKLLPGGTNRSYGIQVAALAGVPAQVVARAKELLHNIEQGEFNRQGEPRIATSGRSRRPDHPSQLRLFNNSEHPAIKQLREMQPDLLSPREALEQLYQLKGLLDGE